MRNKPDYYREGAAEFELRENITDKYNCGKISFLTKISLFQRVKRINPKTKLLTA